jgi:IclR family KDG regulon transcriptional repressor
MEEVKSAMRVMKILTLLLDHPLGLTISRVSLLLSIPKSSTHELLHSMTQEQYLQQEGNAYTLGIRVFEIGQSTIRNSALIQFARPIMKSIGEELKESVHLATLAGTEVVYLSKMQFRKDIRLESIMGTRLPSYATGIGKAILSTMTNDEVSELFSEIVFKQFTPKTITCINNLHKNLDEIRVKGFAEDQEEYSKGIYCYAMPIKDMQNRTLGAISISMPGMPSSQERRDKVLQLLGEATSILSQNVRYTTKRIKSSH